MTTIRVYLGHVISEMTKTPGRGRLTPPLSKIYKPCSSMTDEADKENDEKQSLPAFQRSKQISDIFTNVENILPSMEFSDTENEEDVSESVSN